MKIFKSTFLITFLFLSILPGKSSAFYSEPVETWDDAYALHEVLDIIQITSMEFGWYFFMSKENHLSISEIYKFNCSSSDGSEMVQLFKKALDRFLNYYPDEPLPFGTAENELMSYISNRSFEKCKTVEKNHGREVEQIFFIEKFPEEGPVIKIEFENL